MHAEYNSRPAIFDIMGSGSNSLSANIENLLAANHLFATANFKPPPTVAEYGPLLAANPHLPRICIVTCCDPRVVPEYIFGLSIGDAIVIRIAGGSIEPALASILAIDSIAPLTDVIIMRHTDCGTAYWTDEGVRKALRERANGEKMVGRRGEAVSSMAFCESEGDAGDEQQLRQDIEWLKASPLVRDGTKSKLVGMLYTTHTGRVRVAC